MTKYTKPGVDYERVLYHHDFLGDYTLSELDSAATEVGVGWYLTNTKWDAYGEIVEAVERCTARAMAYEWDEYDGPSDQGDYFNGGDNADPVDAVRTALRQAFVFILERWDDGEEEDEEDEA